MKATIVSVVASFPLPFLRLPRLVSLTLLLSLLLMTASQGRAYSQFAKDLLKTKAQKTALSYPPSIADAPQTSPQGDVPVEVGSADPDPEQYEKAADGANPFAPPSLASAVHCPHPRRSVSSELAALYDEIASKLEVPDKEGEKACRSNDEAFGNSASREWGDLENDDDEMDKSDLDAIRALKSAGHLPNYIDEIWESSQVQKDPKEPY